MSTRLRRLFSDDREVGLLWLVSAVAEGTVSDEFSAARLCMVVMIFLVAQFSRFRSGQPFFAAVTEESNWTADENPECHLLCRLKYLWVPESMGSIDDR